ncbi:unnamed protein product, partial [Mesorhabditis belari]|uniref:Arrestin-like N-terminal domain-containing protein n=1 Tax=Mesorhabditis belari TaxID=2138241 RepID=A0AAF3J2N3_9BILA
MTAEPANSNTNVPPKTFAKVVELETKELYYSDKDERLVAKVVIDNNSDLKHSCQIVFRGYVRRQNDLVYEFLHEQAWVVAGQGETSHTVEVEAWLNRFPPSMEVMRGTFIEYSVRASIDPWFLNHHVEKIFFVRRTLKLKMPHIAAFETKQVVNECVGHGGLFHKNCTALNGYIQLEKGAYTWDDEIEFKWDLDCTQKLQQARVTLLKTMEFRSADPGHHMAIETIRQELVTEQKQIGNGKGHIRLKVPKNLHTSIEMSLWNVLAIKYFVLLQIKAQSASKWVDIYHPMILNSEHISHHEGEPDKRDRLHKRAVDENDDSEDDDDCDSEIDDLDEVTKQRDLDARSRGLYSIDIDGLRIVSDDGLHNAFCEVAFVVNSRDPRPLRSLRLMMIGEVRAGPSWYEFIRYKSIVTTDPRTLFSPGEHRVKIGLPFLDNQYDTHILPPSLGEDIKYTVKVTTSSWKINQLEGERDFQVTRWVDTWAREEFTAGFHEKLGKFGMTMTQRNFQKGKWIFATVYGPAKRVRMSLIQQRRLRQPGLKSDGSYCTERLVTSVESPENKDLWPEEWALHIPPHITPSIEVSYWNVVVISYALEVISYSEVDGHEHRHVIPVWIGCTDDKLGPPKEPMKREGDPGMEYVDPIEELPEFEVVKEGEIHDHPFWVQRLNDDTYNELPVNWQEYYNYPERKLDYDD